MSGADRERIDIERALGALRYEEGAAKMIRSLKVQEELAKTSRYYEKSYGDHSLKDLGESRLFRTPISKEPPKVIDYKMFTERFSLHDMMEAYGGRHADIMIFDDMVKEPDMIYDDYLGYEVERTLLLL